MIIHLKTALIRNKLAFTKQQYLTKDLFNAEEIQMHACRRLHHEFIIILL